MIPAEAYDKGYGPIKCPRCYEILGWAPRESYLPDDLGGREPMEVIKEWAEDVMATTKQLIRQHWSTAHPDAEPGITPED